MPDKAIVTDVKFIPDVSWYSPVEMKGCSPRSLDEKWRKHRKKIWLPKRVRQHPRMKKAFGKPKSQKAKRHGKEAKVKSKPEGFNRLVEQAYKKGKL